MGNKDWFVDSGIIGQGSVDQGFEGIHYFQSMCLDRKAIVQTNKESITENFENTGAVVSSKLIEIRKLPSPALFKIILKLEAFKDTKQHIVSTTITESQMTIKYLKDVLTMLAVVSAVRENDLDHTIYARHNKYQHVNLNNLLRREKSILKNLITNGCGA